MGPLSDAEAQRLLNACKVKALITTHKAGIQLVLTDGNWAIWSVPDNARELHADYQRRCKRPLAVATE